MSARSLNKAQLIGNLTRDPELRYTPQGTAVCTFGLATNRTWVTESKEKKEDAEFHRIVAWNKLAELCSQLLFKGRKVFVEGRLQTREWTSKDGVARQTTEVVITDMIILDSKRAPGVEAVETQIGQEAEVAPTEEVTVGAVEPAETGEKVPGEKKVSGKKAASPSSKTIEVEEKKVKEKTKEEAESNEVKPEDIPF